MPDEPVLIQSERIGEHHRLLDQLLDEQKAYRCFCTPEELKARLVQHHGQELDYTKYDRLCRDKKITEQDLKKPFAIRFKLPDHGIIEFTDLIRGSIAVDVGELDDFVIARSDKTPMYNFVVVVDDAYMRITHIIVAKSIFLIRQNRYYYIKRSGILFQLSLIYPLF